MNIAVKGCRPSFFVACKPRNDGPSGAAPSFSVVGRPRGGGPRCRERRFTGAIRAAPERNRKVPLKQHSGPSRFNGKTGVFDSAFCYSPGPGRATLKATTRITEDVFIFNHQSSASGSSCRTPHGSPECPQYCSTAGRRGTL